MENRLARIRQILDRLVDENGGYPHHSGKGRFWNLPRDQFVTSSIYGKTPVVPGSPGDSFLVDILRGPSAGFARMPQGGPYASADETQLIVEWIEDGAPDVDDEPADV